MSIKELLDKAKEFFENNRQWVLWGGAVILVSGLLIWGILVDRKKDRETNSVPLIENPLKYDVRHKISVDPNKVKDKDFPESLEVFKLVGKNYHKEIDSILQKLGKTGLTKKTIQSSLYLWRKGETYVEYVPDSQHLYFNFEDPADSGISIEVDSAQSGADLLSQFYEKFLGRDYEFLNIKINRTGNRIRIEGNRNINGYPLFIRGHQTYTDYLVTDVNGNIHEGSLTLIETQTEEAEKISLVDVRNLQLVMADSNYPKEIFQVYGPSHDDKIEEEEIEGDADHFEDEVDISSQSVLESVELVYYFSDMGFKQLSPTFRIESEGILRQDGKNITVPLIIYANALDPDRVYVPSNE